MSITADRATAATTLTRRQLQQHADWIAAEAVAAATEALRRAGVEAAWYTLGEYVAPYSAALAQGAKPPTRLRMVVPRWWKATGRTS